MATEQKISDFDQFLTSGITEMETEAAKDALTNAALQSHLEFMGKSREADVNYHSGSVLVSLKNYFLNTVPESNTVNSLAISTIPEFTYHSGYGDSVDTKVSWGGMKNINRALGTADNALKAARIGIGTQWAIGMALDFKFDKGNLDWDTRCVAEKLCTDLNDAYVGELGDVAKRVKEKGYQDFLDYLLDSKMLLSGRVDTLFEHGPQSSNTLF
jgi:hypothetical protein